MGVGRDCVTCERAILDFNCPVGDGARLVNEGGVEDADGDELLHPRRHHRRPP
jgi:hypothetical protein